MSENLENKQEIQQSTILTKSRPLAEGDFHPVVHTPRQENSGVKIVGAGNWHIQYLFYVQVSPDVSGL